MAELSIRETLHESAEFLVNGETVTPDEFVAAFCNNEAVSPDEFRVDLGPATDVDPALVERARSAIICRIARDLHAKFHGRAVEAVNGAPQDDGHDSDTVDRGATHRGAPPTL